MELLISKIPKTISDRLYIKDDIKFNGVNCWLWNGSLRDDGYSDFYIEKRNNINGKHVTLHLYLYKLLIGKVPEGLHLDHLCRNRQCVNVYFHLEPVTIQENVQRGNSALLNKEQVLEIKRLRAEKNWTYERIAKIYNVSPITISTIFRNINPSWTNIVGDFRYEPRSLLDSDLSKEVYEYHLRTGIILDRIAKKFKISRATVSRMIKKHEQERLYQIERGYIDE